MALIFTDQNFSQEVEQSSIPVLVDFWAPWCGPCRVTGPIIEELAKEYPETAIKIGKVNVDENPVVAGKFGIMSIPTILIFKNGKVADQIVGARPKGAFKEKIDRIVGN